MPEDELEVQRINDMYDLGQQHIDFLYANLEADMRKSSIEMVLRANPTFSIEYAIKNARLVYDYLTEIPKEDE